MGDDRTIGVCKQYLTVALLHALENLRYAILDRQLPISRVAGDLDVLHDYAVRLFNAAITQELHDAMGPTPI